MPETEEPVSESEGIRDAADNDSVLLQRAASRKKVQRAGTRDPFFFFPDRDQTLIWKYRSFFRTIPVFRTASDQLHTGQSVRCGKSEQQFVSQSDMAPAWSMDESSEKKGLLL